MSKILDESKNPLSYKSMAAKLKLNIYNYKNRQQKNVYLGLFLLAQVLQYSVVVGQHAEFKHQLFNNFLFLFGLNLFDA